MKSFVAALKISLDNLRFFGSRRGGSLNPRHDGWSGGRRRICAVNSRLCSGFCAAPGLEATHNAAERALRGVVIARKL